MEQLTHRSLDSGYHTVCARAFQRLAGFAVGVVLAAGCDTGMDKYNDDNDNGIPDDQEEQQPTDDQADDEASYTVEDCTSLCGLAIAQIGTTDGCQVECGVNILPNFSGTVVTSVAVLLNNIVSGDFEGGQSCELVTVCDGPCGELLGECMAALPEPPEIEMLSICTDEYQECLDSYACYDALEFCNDAALELYQICMDSSPIGYCYELYEGNLITCTCLYDACLSGSDATACDGDASRAQVASPTQTGPWSFRITRALIDEQLARLTALATETFVMPGLDDAGKLIGFRLGSIRSDNVLYRLGLRDADVLVAVNGKSLIHNIALDELLSLRKASTVKLTILRRGVQRQLSYDILP
jgi:hypothetical protein